MSPARASRKARSMRTREEPGPAGDPERLVGCLDRRVRSRTPWRAAGPTSSVRAIAGSRVIPAPSDVEQNRSGDPHRRVKAAEADLHRGNVGHGGRTVAGSPVDRPSHHGRAGALADAQVRGRRGTSRTSPGGDAPRGSWPPAPRTTISMSAGTATSRQSKPPGRRCPHAERVESGQPLDARRLEIDEEQAHHGRAVRRRGRR